MTNSLNWSYFPPKKSHQGGWLCHAVFHGPKDNFWSILGIMFGSYNKPHLDDNRELIMIGDHMPYA